MVAIAGVDVNAPANMPLPVDAFSPTNWMSP